MAASTALCSRLLGAPLACSACERQLSKAQTSSRTAVPLVGAHLPAWNGSNSFLGARITVKSEGLAQKAGHKRAIQAQIAFPTTSTSTATLVTPDGTSEYPLPSWSKFEGGEVPVFWETDSFGRLPASGEPLRIYFNPRVTSELNVEGDYVAFNGGFNQPIMCGGTPRSMTKIERGTSCDPFYSIRINVPVHAQSLEFSFTDGKEWHGSYKIAFELPTRFRNQPQSFFDQGLAAELSAEDGCENAIFPDSVVVQDRCMMPGGMVHEGGDRCMLDLVPGCMDPSSALYDPFANVDDGSCDLDGYNSG